MSSINFPVDAPHLVLGSLPLCPQFCYIWRAQHCCEWPLQHPRLISLTSSSPALFPTVHRSCPLLHSHPQLFHPEPHHFQYIDSPTTTFSLIKPSSTIHELWSLDLTCFSLFMSPSCPVSHSLAPFPSSLTVAPLSPCLLLWCLLAKPLLWINPPFAFPVLLLKQITLPGTVFTSQI